MSEECRQKILALISELAADAHIPLRVYTDMDAMIESLRDEGLGRRVKNEMVSLHLACPCCEEVH